VDIRKENVLKDLEVGILEYITIEEFLLDQKKQFGREDNEMMKIAKLKKME